MKTKTKTRTKTKEKMNPLSNTVFLRIYSDCEKDEKLASSLRSLLNAILMERKVGNPPLIQKIKRVQVEKTEFGDQLGDRGVRFDVVVTSVDDSEYNLEIQLLLDPDMISRDIFYLMRSISKQLKQGEDFHKLNPVSMISILDFRLFDSARFPSFYQTASLLMEDCEEDIPLSDELALYFVELPKFRDTKRDYTKPLHVWLDYFLKGYGDEMMKEELLKQNPDIAAFDAAFMKLQEDDDAWVQYELERRSREFIASLQHGAIAQGKAEGKMEGITQGRAEGKMEGKMEGIALTKKVLKLFAVGHSVEDIARECQASIAEVQDILSE